MEDRVFTHALATVRRLPRTGSSRPPPSARLRLYGLYKQSMEGDVESILPRPTLPSVSPDPNNNSKSNNVHRYASRDLRVREAEAEIEKWDAWHTCAGMSKTEAKRRYISTLIETMKEYASGTQEARELVAELEFVWNQIRSQSGSSEDGDADSPTRRLERAGLKQLHSFNSNATGQTVVSGRPSGAGNRTNTDPNRLRVLSPVSQRDSNDVVEAEEIDPDAGALIGPLTTASPQLNPNIEWRTRMESILRQLATEVAALREEMSANHLLSSSSLSPSLTSRRRRLLYRTLAWAKWLAWTLLRQAVLNATLVLLFILWARWKGHKDRRVEHWVRRRWVDAEAVYQSINTWLRGALPEFMSHARSQGS